MAGTPPPAPNTEQAKRYRGSDNPIANAHLQVQKEWSLQVLGLHCRAADLHIFVDLPYNQGNNHYDACMRIMKIAMGAGCRYVPLQPMYVKDTSPRQKNPLYDAYPNFSSIDNNGRPTVPVLDRPALVGKLYDLFKPLRDGPFSPDGPTYQSISSINLAIVHSSVRRQEFANILEFKDAIAQLPEYKAALVANEPPQPSVSEIQKLRREHNEALAKIRLDLSRLMGTVSKLENKVHCLESISFSPADDPIEKGVSRVGMRPSTHMT